MIKIEVNQMQRDKAATLYPFDGLNNSITNGESQIFGALGEIVVHDWFIDKANVQYDSTKDFDLVINGRTVEVKTKKITKSARPTHNVTVAKTSTHQHPDQYIFVSVKEDQSIAWIMGSMSRKDFFDKATFNREGEVDPSGNGEWKFTADCYNLKAYLLNKL